MDSDKMVEISEMSEMMVRVGNLCLITVCDCGINDGALVADVGGLPPYHDGCDCVVYRPGLAILAGDEIE